jgi:hypothetical protein
MRAGADGQRLNTMVKIGVVSQIITIACNLAAAGWLSGLRRPAPVASAAPLL